MYKVCMYYEENVLKVSKVKVLILQKYGPDELYINVLDYCF